MYHHFANNGLELANFFSILRDIIVSVTAVMGVWIAVPGLNAWKKQLLGRHDYELARRYLRAAYRLRDALKYVRNPFISIGEQFDAAKKMNISEKEVENDHNKGVESAYNVRWQEVAKAFSDLDSESLDAEISWGKKAVEIREDLNGCVRKLRINVTNYLRKLPELKADNKILYDSMNESDEFSLEINSAIKKIEIFLEPHLKQE